MTRHTIGDHHRYATDAASRSRDGIPWDENKMAPDFSPQRDYLDYHDSFRYPLFESRKVEANFNLDPRFAHLLGK